MLPDSETPLESDPRDLEPALEEGMDEVDLDATLNDDDRLLHQILQGNEQAFRALVLKYQERVFGLALGMLRDEAEAEDVTQEAFLAVFRKLEGFRRDAAFSSWLYRVTVNSAMMRLRRRRFLSPVQLEVGTQEFDSDGHPTLSVEDGSHKVDRRLENHELSAQIRAAVDKLPEKYRLVFLLSDVDELSMKEIGEILELSVPNVKTRLHRARLFLRQELSRYLKQ